MGGLYGNAAATALEDCPSEARGIISGLLQQGYAFGYLLATAFARGLVDTTPHGWRPLYWFAACPPVLIILFRLCLPETETFRRRQATREEVRGGVAASFMSEGKVALKRHWLLLVYLVLLMAGFNFMVCVQLSILSLAWFYANMGFSHMVLRIFILQCWRISFNSLKMP